jgi:hypothetical protein
MPETLDVENSLGWNNSNESSTSQTEHPGLTFQLFKL